MKKLLIWSITGVSILVVMSVLLVGCQKKDVDVDDIQDQSINGYHWIQTLRMFLFSTKKIHYKA